MNCCKYYEFNFVLYAFKLLNNFWLIGSNKTASYFMIAHKLGRTYKMSLSPPEGVGRIALSDCNFVTPIWRQYINLYIDLFSNRFSGQSAAEMNKYRLLWQYPLDDVELVTSTYWTKDIEYSARSGHAELSSCAANHSPSITLSLQTACISRKAQLIFVFVLVFMKLMATWKDMQGRHLSKSNEINWSKIWTPWARSAN